MSSFLERISVSPAILDSQVAKLTLVAAVASFTTSAVILGVQGSQKKRRVKQLKDDLRKSIPPPPVYGEDGSFSQPHHHHHHLHFAAPNTTLLPGTAKSIVAAGTASRAIEEGGEFEMDEELVKEQLSRNIAFLGQEGVDKLRKSFVVIVGAGMEKKKLDDVILPIHFF